jgi:calcium binding protein 39
MHGTIRETAANSYQARKDVGHIYNTLLRRSIGSRLPTVELIVNKPEIIFATLRGYADAEVALNTGMILKEMLRYEPLAKILLYSDQYVGWGGLH